MKNMEFQASSIKCAVLGISATVFLGLAVMGCSSNDDGNSPSSPTNGSANCAGTLVSIQVTPANPRVESGKTQQMTATGTYADGCLRDITTSVTWSAVTATNGTLQNPTCSSNLTNASSSCSNGTPQAETAAVAIITSGGLASAVSATGVYTGTRTATLTATSGATSGSTTLKYGPKPRTMHVVVDPNLVTGINTDFEPNFPNDNPRLLNPFSAGGATGCDAAGNANTPVVLRSADTSSAVNQGTIPVGYGILGDSTLWNFPEYGLNYRMPDIFSTSGLIVNDTVQKGCFTMIAFCDIGGGVEGNMSVCYSRY